MGASLSLTVSESNVDYANNTSVVTATLKIKATGATWNGNSRSGYITIDGTKYNFSSSFGKGKTTTLATKSKTVAHNADGTKSVSVKGYYSTGVSPGNLSTTKSITLTAIPRYNYIYYNMNGGDGVLATQTKTYNQGIALHPIVPSRTGYNFLYWSGYGGNYAPSSIYNYNVDTTMVAQWAEKTATVSYYSLGSLVTTDTIRYTTEYRAKELTKVGYTLQGWSTSADSQEVEYAPGDIIKSANVIPYAITLFAVWTPNEYQITFDGNGADSGYPPSSQTVVYNTQFIFPDQGTLEKVGYEFKGWTSSKDSKTPQFVPTDSTTWATAADVTFYAVWGEITVPIRYYRNTVESSFNDSSTYSLYISTTVIQHHSYMIPDNIAVPNLTNYTFTGYWQLGSPNSTQYTKFGITFPTGVVPYDYTITPADGFLTVGSIITDIVDTVMLYPVYRDNTPSVISSLFSTYEYIPDVVKETDYFAYLTGQITVLTTSITDENVIMATKFRTSAGSTGVSLDISQATATLKSDELSPTTIDLNPAFLRSVYNSDLNTQDLYLIYRTTGLSGGKLINPTTTSYILTITGIKDSFGKSISDILLIISPPKIVRDVNFNGDAVAFFREAPDYTDIEKQTTHEDNELWNNGLLVSHDYLLSDDDESFKTKLEDEYNITGTDLTNLYIIDSISLSKLIEYILSKIQ